MKKVIDGKTYNTETAQHLGRYWNGLGNSDFRNISENLYQTKKGRFFLAGKGGAMTRYSESYGGMSSNGSKIFVLTEEKALAWAEQYMGVDDIEKYFDVEEG